MTYEELKAEAKAMGYNLIKIPEKVKLLPCVCGRKRIDCWYRNDHREYYRCVNCGLTSSTGKNNREAKLNWNKMIEEKKKDAEEKNG